MTLLIAGCACVKQAAPGTAAPPLTAKPPATACSAELHITGPLPTSVRRRWGPHKRAVRHVQVGKEKSVRQRRRC